MDTDQFKRRLIGNLAAIGARSLKLSGKRQMKLREWIVPYLVTEFDMTTEPLPIEEIRKFIDQWESADLDEGSYKYYYVDKDSKGDAGLSERVML